MMVWMTAGTRVARLGLIWREIWPNLATLAATQLSPFLFLLLKSN